MHPRVPADGGPPGEQQLPQFARRFFLADNTPAIAFADGVVERSDDTGKPGLIRLAHGGNLKTEYRHLFRRDVKVGDRVREGQVIGTIGHNPKGFRLNHLHFALLQGGTKVDPEPTLRSLDAVKHPGLADFVMKAGLVVGAGYLAYRYVFT